MIHDRVIDDSPCSRVTVASCGALSVHVLRSLCRVMHINMHFACKEFSVTCCCFISMAANNHHIQKRCLDKFGTVP